MKFEKRSHYSGALGREMHFNVYGHAGKPVIIFPSSGGSQNEFADFGMIDACRTFIDQGLIKVYTPDSIDGESWLSDYKAPWEKAAAHNAYDAYIIHELVPLIRHESHWGGSMIAAGCSMGGFHTINFALRHPDLFDTSIAMSGVYDARFFTGEFEGNVEVYYNSPIDSIWGQEDPWFLDRYRQNDFIVCVGQGAWEEPHIADTKRLEHAFQAKNISGWFDFWGPDVAHDWEWWRIQWPYYLNVLRESGKL